MKKLLLSATAFLSLTISVGTAQTASGTTTAKKIIPCNTYHMQEYYAKTIPGYQKQLDAVAAKNEQEFEIYKQKLAADRANAQRTSSISATYTYTVPVVFHVLHLGEPMGTGTNVSDAIFPLVLDQVNRDYARKGADTSSIDPLYEPLYVNSHMHFVLAKKDPYGNCTTGIIHHYDPNSEWDQSNLFNYKYSTVGTYNWSSARYLNVYIVDNIIPEGAVLGGGTIVGYTHLPGTAPNVGSDAIVYNRSFLTGNNYLESRSLSHEIGHWFGLSHTFGGTNNAGVICGNDDIYDTPATAGFYSDCPPFQTLNDSCDPGHRPNLQNFMDYSGCPLMFTQGQTDKIRFSAAASTANRNYLTDTANLVFTGIWNKLIVHIDTNFVTGKIDTTFSYPVAPATVCGPTADFYATKAMLCQGQSLVYNNTSYNNVTGLTFMWQFDGGTPTTSTLSAPSVTYLNPGNYATTLTVTNAAGSSTKVINPFVNASWHVDQASYPVMEGFENSAGIYPNGWNARNPDYGSLTWEQSNNGSGSAKCLVLPNANDAGSTFIGGNIDILETSQYNFSNTSSITLSFDYSYARFPGVTRGTGSQIKFEYSLDCGGTWSTVPGTGLGSTAADYDSTMAARTGSVLIAPYIPLTPAKWKTVTCNSTSLSGLNGKGDVKFRFWYKASATGQAQNLYLDNFNISGTVGLDELGNTIGLSIYPNPTSSSSTVEFNSPVNAKVNVSVFDVTGRLVEESNFDAVAGSLTKYNVNKNTTLKAGIYFVGLTLNGQKITKKLIIE